jgi:hypothetical protein
MTDFWVCMVGVVRPDVDRVISNIHETMATVHSLAPGSKFCIISYDDEDGPALGEAISHLVDHFELVTPAPIDRDAGRSYRDGAGGRTTTLRMLRSVEAAVQAASLRGAQWILRTRLDCSLRKLKLPPEPWDMQSYYVPRDLGNNITDNIGFACSELMCSVWNRKNSVLQGRDNEQVIENAVARAGAVIQSGLVFEFYLFQSSSVVFKNVVQWSRRDRNFKTDDDGIRFRAD